MIRELGLCVCVFEIRLQFEGITLAGGGGLLALEEKENKKPNRAFI